MKKKFLLFALIATTLASFGQTKPIVKKPVATAKPIMSKFGALAIDRSNGFYYGWSFDYATLAEAEKKAIEECNKKGGNCTVVLSYKGTGCAAYRTIEGSVGTAFGWGIAKTKEEADEIATKECLKRSNGKNPTSFVWSCNSLNTGILTEIYNASSEIISTVQIGNQIWTNVNLNLNVFRNGDIIPEAKSSEEWYRYYQEGKAAWCYLDYKSENGLIFGKLYNLFAVTDPRGLAPKSYRISTRDDWQKMAEYIGDFPSLGGKLKSKNGWEKFNGTNNYGFNALPGGNSSVTKPGGASSFWSSTPKNKDYMYGVTLYGYTQSFEIGGFSNSAGRYVRCLKDQ